MLDVLITLIIYKPAYSFPYKCKLLSTKFRKRLLYNSKENNVPIVTFDAYFDTQCVNIA